MSKIVLRDFATFSQIVEAFPGTFPLSEGGLVHLGYGRKKLPFIRVPLWRKADVRAWLGKNHSNELVAKFARAIGLEESTQPARKRK
jgi:hypothetical protein